jgi:hypothetical protein
MPTVTRSRRQRRGTRALLPQHQRHAPSWHGQAIGCLATQLRGADSVALGALELRSLTLAHVIAACDVLISRG